MRRKEDIKFFVDKFLIFKGIKLFLNKEYKIRNLYIIVKEIERHNKIKKIKFKDTLMFIRIIISFE